MAVYYNRVKKIFIEVNENEENKQILDYYGYDQVCIASLSYRRIYDENFMIEFLVIPYQTDDGYVCDNQFAELITELDITKELLPRDINPESLLICEGVKKIDTIDEVRAYLDTLQIVINVGRPVFGMANDGSYRSIQVDAGGFITRSEDFYSRDEIRGQIFRKWEGEFLSAIGRTIKGKDWFWGNWSQRVDWPHKKAKKRGDGVYKFYNSPKCSNDETRDINIGSYQMFYKGTYYVDSSVDFSVSNDNCANVVFLPYVSYVILSHLRCMDISVINRNYIEIKSEYDKIISKLKIFNDYQDKWYLNYRFQLYDARNKNLEEFLKSFNDEEKKQKPYTRNRTYRIRDNIR